MNRRHFLRALLAAPIAATLDVEKLLWVPGQMVTVPAMPLAFHKEAFAMAMDPLLGISIRFVQQYDIVADRHPTRMDLLREEGGYLRWHVKQG